jgi:O-antigen/teichoic acid export membrane protein
MELAIRTGKNLFYKAVGEILTRLLAFLFFAIIARKLGQADFGKYSFAYSLTILCVPVIDFGLNSILVRDIAKKKEDIGTYIANINTLKIFFSLISFFVIYLVSYLAGYHTTYGNIIILMAFVSIATGLLEYITAIFNAFEKMNYEALIKFINKVFLLAAGMVALYLGLGLQGLLKAMIVVSGLSVVVGLVLVKTKIAEIFTFKADTGFIKNILYVSTPIFLSAIFLLMYHQISIILLPIFHYSNAEIGLFASSMKLVEIVSAVPVLIVVSSFPVLSDFMSRSKQLFLESYKQINKLLFVAALSISLLGLLFSKEIILLIYGEQFAASNIIFSIMLWSFVFIFLNCLMMQALIIVHKQNISIYTALGAFAVNVILNIILLPQYGVIGAGFAFVITELILFLLNIYVFMKLDIPVNWDSCYLKLIVITLLSVILMYGLDINYWLKTILVIIFYFSGMWFFRVLTSTDITYIKNLIFSKKIAFSDNIGNFRRPPDLFS